MATWPSTASWGCGLSMTCVGRPRSRSGQTRFLLGIFRSSLVRPTTRPRLHAGDHRRGRRTGPIGSYLGHIDHAATRFGELFCALAEDDGLPALFHCHGGKDRTGLAAALLLEALGVERQAILDDYELTARYWQRDDQVFERLMNAGLPPEAAVGVLSAPRWVLASALEYLDRDYNGIEPYLTGPGAMRSADLRRLSDRLLTPLS